MSGRVPMMKAARMALAEIGKPGMLVNTYQPKGDSRFLTCANDADAYKAVCLAVLRFGGPDSLVRCPKHSFRSCDLIPVSWALLGHTCGRAS